MTAAEAALQKQEREDAERPGKEQSVLCTLRKGWAVAARRLAQIAALRGKSRERHKEFSVKRIKGRGPGAETKEIFANIPDSFDTLVGKAAKDNNQLQHKINVHEHALGWISIFEKSKHKQEICRRLEDCSLLPGTSAAFTATPSCGAMQIGIVQT